MLRAIVNWNTLDLYSVAGVVSLCLGVLLVAFQNRVPGTLSVRQSTLAIAMLSVALIAAGKGPAFPRWATVLGMNLTLVASAAVLHAGLRAFVEESPSRLDRFGFGVVAAAAPLFAYWGLVEPNGVARSIVFSLAVALITVRTVALLLPAALKPNAAIGLRLLAALYVVGTLWMALRALTLSIAEPVPAPQRGDNPTTWVTVFWFIILLAAIAAAIVSMEIHRLGHRRASGDPVRATASAGMGRAQGKLWRLWALVGIVFLTLASEGVVVFTEFYAQERERMLLAARLGNEAAAAQTAQLLGQVDALLLAVRGYYQRTQSLNATQHFILSLQFDQDLVENIYLISGQGQILGTFRAPGEALSVAQSDYFVEHRNQGQDELKVSAVSPGILSGQPILRLTRRIEMPDGSFGGVVLAAIKPEVFDPLYRRQGEKSRTTTSLVGTLDHRLRARSPAPGADQWALPLQSAIWDAGQSSGVVLQSAGDGLPGAVLVFQQLQHLPLVVITEWPEAELMGNMLERWRWLLLTVGLVFLLGLVLAWQLSLEIVRRSEQERFLAMLSHELKTPMAVLRMTLGATALAAAVQARCTRAIDDMHAIVERCLQLDRLEQGRLQVQSHRCAVRDVLVEVRHACTEPARVEMAGDLDLQVVTDAQWLQVIVSNLVDNALKYGAPQAPVRIALQALAHQGRDGVQIVVANTPGTMGRPDPSRLFKKYYRSPNARGKTGSGLGLHIAHGLARKLGARLSYEDTPDMVRLVVWLPLQQPQGRWTRLLGRI